ncbi:MAG: metal-dependent hydrolase, partial [Nitrospinota bacterium]
MDPVTHALSGMVAASTGIRPRLGNATTSALVVGAVFPDIDFTLTAINSTFYLSYHRGLTHSIFGAPLFALALAGILRLSLRRGNFWLMVLLATLGMYTHVFLDLITSFGTQLFTPFSNTRYSLDLVFLVDPFLSLTLGVPLLMVAFLPVRKSVYVARLAPILASLYIIFAAWGHGVALEKFKTALAERGIKPTQVAAIPGLGSPFRWLGLGPGDTFAWNGLAHDEEKIYRASVRVLEEKPPDIRVIPQHTNSRYEKIAANFEEVKLFLWFARFPQASYYKDGNNHVVEYFDHRFNLFPNR